MLQTVMEFTLSLSNPSLSISLSLSVRSANFSLLWLFSFLPLFWIFYFYFYFLYFCCCICTCLFPYPPYTYRHSTGNGNFRGKCFKLRFGIERVTDTAASCNYQSSHWIFGGFSGRHRVSLVNRFSFFLVLDGWIFAVYFIVSTKMALRS